MTQRPRSGSSAFDAAAVEADFRWLEQVEGPQALQWVSTRSAHTLERAAANPLFGVFEAQARAILDAPDRLPWVQLRGEFAYNFWRDAAHPRGVWRRKPLADFLANPAAASDAAAWTVLLDVDSLAAAEDENWVYRSTVVHRPDDERALCLLSRGGADAIVVREFDLTLRRFVTPDAQGFSLPAAKTSPTWIDADTLAVTSPLGEDHATDSGYGRTVRLLRRGTALDAAPVVWEGQRSDVAVGLSHDPLTGRVVASRALDFHHATHAYLPHHRELLASATSDSQPAWRHLPLPTDCRMMSSGAWMYLLPRTEEHLGGVTVPAGGLAVVAWSDIDAANATQPFTADTFPAPKVLFAPSKHQSVEDVSVLADGVLVELMENMSSRLLLFTPPLHQDAWSTRDLTPLAEASSTSVVSTDPYARGGAGQHALVATSSPVEPSSMVYVGDDASVRTIARSPHRFDASTTVVEQGFATSEDGTSVPYFVMCNSAHSGPAPTILYGYGGFEIAQKPAYGALRGKLWLERGGTYVVAGIRGGGEYGPDWHAAALRENRPRAFEDMAAVAQDLVARGYCTTAQLGMTGGSNGGLLAGVMLTRYPKLFGAIAIAVPLLDMLRYHRLLAGASWIAEYGDPDTDDREFIARYSPIHNVRSAADVVYPPTLITTSTRDDRVHPGHARKMVAVLEEAGQPVRYYENTEGGHAGAADNAQEARKAALLYGFFAEQLGLV